MSTPKRKVPNLLRPIAFVALAGVSKAELQGEQITCEQQNPLREVPGSAELCENFVNWANDAASVLRFTSRYGALEAHKPGEKFSFHIADWQKEQAKIRHGWDVRQFMFNLHKGLRVETAVVEIGVAQGEELRWNEGQLQYRAASLSRLLQIQLTVIPKERLRKCENPGCEAPYFVAHHLGQWYCSAPCARWAQAKAKRIWWEQHGPDWRRDRNNRAKASRGNSKKRSRR